MEPIENGDSVVFFNFHPDRAREITRTFVDPDFDGFARRDGALDLYFVCMTQYDATMPNVHVAFKPQSLKNTFGEYICQKGLHQLRIAETEKYAHVTFFFNGGVEATYPGEDRALIASPKVATYDLKPEMSAYEVTDELLRRIASDKYDVIVLNFANCDMVGHTGVFKAAEKAVEAVDECLGKGGERHPRKGRRRADHGRPRQRRQDVRAGRFPLHRAHHQPGSAGGGGVPVQAARGGKACRPRAHHAENPRTAAAGRDGRQVDHPRIDGALKSTKPAELLRVFSFQGRNWQKTQVECLDMARGFE